MHRNGTDSTSTREPRRRWVCSVANRARARRQYDELSSLELARKRLLERRQKAVARMRKRAERAAANG